MNYKIGTLSAICLLIPLASHAGDIFDAKRLILGVDLGTNTFDASHQYHDELGRTDDTRSLSFILGYEINPSVSLKMAYGHDFSGIQTFYTGLEKSHHIETDWKGYVSVGVANIDYSKHNDLVPGLGVGVGYSPVNNLEFRLGTALYIANDLSDLETIGVTFGIRYQFGQLAISKDLNREPIKAVEYSSTNFDVNTKHDVKVSIYFDFNAIHKEKLDIQFDKLKEIESITVTGHTDHVGNSKVNYKIGQERAQWVASELVNCGYEYSLISIKSMGEDEANSFTDIAKDRRVDVVVKYK